jgi:hypothetical protein
MNRRDLFRLGGGFLMSSAIDQQGLSDSPSSGCRSDGEPDFWEEAGVEQLRTFVSLNKRSEHTCRSVLVGADGEPLNRHNLLVMAPGWSSDYKTIRHVLCSHVPTPLDLPADSDWFKQGEFIKSTMELFFDTGRTTTYDFGSICLCGAWKSGLTRKEEDPRLKVDRPDKDVQIEFLPPDYPWVELNGIGVFPLADIRWGYKHGGKWEKWSEAAKLPIAKITVRRTMSYPFVWTHEEYIYCRAIRDDDYDTLRDTRSPGEADLDKDRTDDVRLASLLGFHKAYGLQHLGADAPYCSLDLELNPFTGQIFSIRGARASYGSMLARMPVEHRAHRNAVNGRSTS